MLGPSGGGVLGLGSGELGGSLFNGPQNTGNDIGRGTASVGTQNLDRNEVGGLGNAVLARTNGTGAVGSVTVGVLVDVMLGDGFSPRGATLELGVVDVNADVYDVYINTLTTGRVVLVESVGVRAELLTVGDTRKALQVGVSRQSHNNRGGAYPCSGVLSLESANNRVLFNERNLWHLPDSLDDGIGKTASVALEIAIVHLADASRYVSDKRVFFVDGLEEVEVVIRGEGGEIILQHDDVRVVDCLVLVLSLEGVEGGERKRRPLAWNVMMRRRRRGYDGGDEDGEIEGEQHLCGRKTIIWNQAISRDQGLGFMCEWETQKGDDLIP